MNYNGLSATQKKCLRYVDQANEHLRNLAEYEEQFDTKWIGAGNLPNFDHYKMLTIKGNEAIELANYGYLEAKTLFNIELYFTQALMVGTAIVGRKSKFFVVTPAQMGKTFAGAIAAVYLAAIEGEKFYFGAYKELLTHNLMGEVNNALQNASDVILSKLENTKATQKRKTRVKDAENKKRFTSGGLIECISLGGKFAKVDSSSAKGKGGNYIIDESSTLPDENWEVAAGRVDSNVRKNGLPCVRLEFSNPDNENHFYQELNVEPMPDTHMRIWCDIRVRIEEGRDTQALSKEEIFGHATFRVDTAIKHNFLCEFNTISKESFFQEDLILEERKLEKGRYFIGVDPAEKGADSYNASLIEMKEDGTLHVAETFDLKPEGDWDDVKTPDLIFIKVLRLIEEFNALYVCIDKGYGELLSYRLKNYAKKSNIIVETVHSGARPCKSRVALGYKSSLESVYIRDELHYILKDFLSNRRITFSPKVAEKIEPQLRVIRTAQSSTTNKLKIESKKDIRRRSGRSPDDVDSIMLGIYAAVRYIQLSVRGRRIG